MKPKILIIDDDKEIRELYLNSQQLAFIVANTRSFYLGKQSRLIKIIDEMISIFYKVV